MTFTAMTRIHAGTGIVRTIAKTCTGPFGFWRRATLLSDSASGRPSSSAMSDGAMPAYRRGQLAGRREKPCRSSRHPG